MGLRYRPYYDLRGAAGIRTRVREVAAPHLFHSITAPQFQTVGHGRIPTDRGGSLLSAPNPAGLTEGCAYRRPFTSRCLRSLAGHGASSWPCSTTRFTTQAGCPVPNPGIEPGLHPYQGRVLPLAPIRHNSCLHECHCPSTAFPNPAPSTAPPFRRVGTAVRCAGVEPAPLALEGPPCPTEHRSWSAARESNPVLCA